MVRAVVVVVSGGGGRGGGGVVVDGNGDIVVVGDWHEEKMMSQTSDRCTFGINLCKIQICYVAGQTCPRPPPPLPARRFPSVVTPPPPMCTAFHDNILQLLLSADISALSDTYGLKSTKGRTRCPHSHQCAPPCSSNHSNNINKRINARSAGTVCSRFSHLSTLRTLPLIHSPSCRSSSFRVTCRGHLPLKIKTRRTHTHTRTHVTGDGIKTHKLSGPLRLTTRDTADWLKKTQQNKILQQHWCSK